MFTSLVLIIVLLAVGFGFLWLAVSGKVGSQSTLLPAPRRAALGIFGMLCWAVGIYVYYTPQSGEKGATSVATWGDVNRARDPATPAVSLREEPAAPRGEPTATTPDGTTTLSPSAAALEAKNNEEIEPALPEKLIAVDGQPAPVAKLEPLTPVEPVAAPVVAAAKPAAAASTQAPASTRPATSMAMAGDHPLEPVQRRAKRPRAPVVSNSRGTTIHVLNSLGEGQSEEKLTLSIEGRPLANLAVSRAKPNVHVPLVLPRPGFLHYTLSGSSLENGYRHTEGRGCIEMLNQSSFEVRRTEDGSGVYLHPVSTRHYR